MIFTDQMHREILLPHWPPRRIVSLVPSQTELLFHLGLENEVVGITRFCVHPKAWFESKQRVGGTKTLNFNKIDTLKPDLIIGNKEENERSQIEALSLRYPVWMSDIATLQDALNMMQATGKLCNREEAATALTHEIQSRFSHPAPQKRRAAYLIWRKPYLVAGSGTFIHNMMEYAGFDNVFAAEARYPEISQEQLQQARPEALLLSSEPYPFQEKHLREFREICPDIRLMLVDGEMFSWYGSRLLLSADYFRELQKTWA